ncbi:MAG: lytic transglycosylase domain-containing protein [Spirochaetales bacterium]|nr:lytic transglycosylase domain-containing protein [Spirochaetales bacterium]
MFLKNNHLLFIALIPLFLLQCCSGSYFNLSRSELAEKLRHKDYAFLDTIDLSKYNIEDAAGYAPGALYYLSFILSEAGKKDTAYQCLELQIKRRELPYSRLALLEYAGQKIDDELYEDAETYLRQYTEAFIDEKNADDFHKLLISSLYWQKKDAETQALIAGHFKLSDTELLAKEPELYMFRAVGKSRLNIEGWENDIRTFFFTARRSELHIRLFLYLKNTDNLLGKFDSHEQALFEAKYKTAAEEYSEAAALFEKTFTAAPDTYLTYAPLLSDFGVASTAGKTRDSHLALLLKLVKTRKTDTIKMNLYEQAGKIANKLKKYTDASAYYQSVYDNTKDAEQKKRALWRILTIAIDAKTIDEKKLFVKYAPLWADPDYFSDAVESLIIHLLQQNDLSGFISTMPLLRDYVPSYLRAQLSYLCGRIILIQEKNREIPVTSKKAEPYFKDVIAVSDWGYYSFLAAYMLGSESFFKKQAFSKPVSHTEFGENEKILLGYIDFGLNKKAYGYMLSHRNELPDSFLSYAAQYFSDREYFLESIHSIDKLHSRNRKVMTERDYCNLYPKAYASLIGPLAEKNSLDTNLVYALVRRESAFDHEISSKAGAIGLSQLMPDTAQWLAGLLKMPSYNLLDPADNLGIGTYFLAYLKKRYELTTHILAAYNAGPGSLKSWKRQYPSLPDDLFVEALDFAETRNFIKNIFTSHVVYTTFYDQKPLGESVRLFFRLQE